MVVRDRVGRKRYIIVENKKILRRIIHEIREKIDDKAKISYYEDDFAILFCRHWFKENIIEFLNSKGIKTYATSGTIKKAKEIMKKL